MQKRYQEEFEKQKPDKKLRYLPNMGSVDLTVEMDSLETLTVTVNPLQAAIIELFSETSTSILPYIREPRSHGIYRAMGGRRTCTAFRQPGRHQCLSGVNVLAHGRSYRTG